MMAAVFEILVTSSVLIVGIFGLRKLTMGKISMRLRYGLWLLVAARLLMPLSLGTSPVSVMNLFQDILQESAMQGGAGRELFRQESNVLGAGESGAAYTETAGTAPSWQNPAQGSAGQSGEAVSVPDKTQSGSEATPAAVTKSERAYGKRAAWQPVAGGVWLLGVLSVSGYLFWMRFRFVRYLRRNRREISEEELPNVMGEKLARRGMRVYRVKGLPSPCLVGRHIYIGEETPGGEQGMLHVLAHEYSHALHGDGFWAFLRCALAALWWFDPLVWAAAFAARQDSDLACDEAAVRLLGEGERFAYGRTLLALLQEGTGKAECPGMPLMFSGSARGVRERITSLAEIRKAEAVVLATVLSLVFLICGCAFTGAADQSGEEMPDATAAEKNSADGQKTEEASSAQNRTMVVEGENEEFARIRKEYDGYVTDGYVNTGELTEEQIAELEERERKEAEQAAFAEALADYADSGLSEDRRVDVQHFYEYNAGKREDAPEEGWYLLCRDEEEAISCYGLYTEGFGCRGVKTLIGEDVNAFDLVWYPSYMNEVSPNIRVLERAQDGKPRRFVWKYVEEESDVVEIWRLAAGFRYDTGTVELKVLPQEDYLSWADWHLSYGIDKEKGQVRVYYDGAANAPAGALDISGYQDFEVEEVQICTDTVAFELDSKVYAEEAGEDFEGVVIHLVPGLKLKGYEGLWNDGLSPLAVELIWDEEKDGGFRFGQPKVDEQYQINSLTQERELQEIRQGKDPENGQDGNGAAANGQDGNGAAASGQDGDSATGDTLAEPLAYPGVHHEVAIIFSNPCPDYERISDPYGERTHPVTGEKRRHNGVDLAAPSGADVLAAADGAVYRTGFDAENGNYVVLWHGDSGQMTYYTHCRDILVSEKDKVSAGDKIATVGQTGRATGPHLHFAVSGDGEWQEPVWGGEK